MLMIDPAQLETLATVLRTGSFDAAASALNVTPSAVSQRIRALEDRMGTALLIRSLPVEPTEAGRRLARHADDLRLLEQSLRRDLGQDGRTDRPTVRIAVNADSLATWFLPALAAVPNMLFDLVIDDQDHSDALLLRGEVAAAITARAEPVPGAHLYPLGALRYLATASPAFRDRWFADGLSPQNLARAPVLTFNAKDRLQRDWAARLTGRRVAMPRLPVTFWTSSSSSSVSISFISFCAVSRSVISVGACGFQISLVVSDSPKRGFQRGDLVQVGVEV
jgi:LysR family transcriptional regulator (chromosome initiation inhibitor)